MIPPVSLIITTFNHAQFLPNAVESGLAQTLTGVEIIVVDDGSTDDTPAVLARFGDRIRCTWQPNRGLSTARNTGLSLAQGAHIAFLDADDLLEPTKLSAQAAILESDPEVGWTFCDVRIQDVQSETATTTSERFIYGRRRLDGWLFPELVHGNFIPSMAPLIRRSIMDVAGRFDETLTALEDWDLWLRLSLIAKAQFLPTVLATYRVQPGSMSQNRARMDHNKFVILDKLSRTQPSPFRVLGHSGRRIVADMHNWFGYEAYSRADWLEASRRLAASFRVLPWQRRAPLLLGLSLLRRWKT